MDMVSMQKVLESCLVKAAWRKGDTPQELVNMSKYVCLQAVI